MQSYKVSIFKRLINPKSYWLLIIIFLFFNVFSFLKSPEIVNADSSNTATTTKNIFTIPSDATAQGTANNQSNSSKWYIKDGILHFGPGVIKFYDQINNWDKYSDQITSISFDGQISLVDASQKKTNIGGFLSNLPNLAKIDNLDNLDVSRTTNFSKLFQNDSKLKELDLSTWDTSNVTGMFKTFLNDSSLSILNTSHWNTEKVEDMGSMFSGDSSLTKLDLSTFDTSNVTNFASMFYSDSNLIDLNISSFNTKNADYTDHMFDGLSKIKTINLPKTFDTSKARGIGAMFSDDISLENIDISNLDTSNALIDSDMNIGDNLFGSMQIDDAKECDNNLRSITLGPKNKLDNNFSISDKISDTWVNIGNGSVKTPQANLSFHTGVDTTDAYKIYDGTAKTVETFVPKLTTVTSDVTIPSNLNDQVVKNVTGTVGKTVLVDVPSIKGYTPDKQKVTANVYNDGTIITTEKVTYKKNPSSHHSSSSSSNHNNHNQNESNKIIKQNADIATYSDKKNVPIYSYNNESMNFISNKELSHGTDWFTDENITINDKIYYRVANNEWVEASRVYPYKNDKKVIKTHAKTITYLSKAEGIAVSNRALAPSTLWKSDRYTTINGIKYYRVATNEFVKASDVDTNY
ncbi:BspA family leucine-rich repeat surface protein [Companilactobacillus musae]|uniref:BspA family leucine-rich repeat surface protein n=1 Tax=Companilactobacillus musae TaxID=1903258 RepID=UPI000E657A33|nr:BspA family leucine-rich repeat surface protein [Companilactobacillus musae]